MVWFWERLPATSDWLSRFSSLRGLVYSNRGAQPPSLAAACLPAQAKVVAIPIPKSGQDHRG